MAKVVVYVLLTTAFVVFLFFSPLKQCNRNHLSQLGGRRIGKQFPVPTFDPLVLKMRRLAEERGLSNQNNNNNNNNDLEKISRIIEDAMEDEYEYMSDKGKLNITMRLLVLFPLVDKAPKDGFVSFKELMAWNTKQAMDRLSYRTQEELELHDKNGDGAISFEEYVPYFSTEEIEKNGMGPGQLGWWKEQFINADVDGNGTLNFEEFNDFLHPEDSKNDAIQKWLLKEKMERMDDNNDGKLNFAEFRENTYDDYKNYAETDGLNLPTPQQKFAQLDVNKNRYLEVEELKPIFEYLQPGEISYAKYYTTYLIQEADDNNDGNLTLEEMLNHEYIFYSTVYSDDNEDDYHDEL